MESVATVPLLIIDDFGMRKLPHTAAEDLLEIIMRRYERASTLLTSNRPVEDWGKLLGDVAAVTAMLDRLLHHGHVLKCGPRSWRTKTGGPERSAMTKKNKDEIWMPGKERPAASRLGIQRPPTTELHHRNTRRNTKPSAGQLGQTAEGLVLPIPPEPAPCHRPWITPQGATPAERVPTLSCNQTIRTLNAQYHQPCNPTP